MKRGTLCRSSSEDECELKEYCNGTSGECTPDLWVMNGHPCSRNTAFCYQGVCQTADKQCQKVFGQGRGEAGSEGAVCSWKWWWEQSVGDTAVQDGTGRLRVLSSQPGDANPRNVPEGLVAVPGNPGMEPMSVGGADGVQMGGSWSIPPRQAAGSVSRLGLGSRTATALNACEHAGGPGHHRAVGDHRVVMPDPEMQRGCWTDHGWGGVFAGAKNGPLACYEEINSQRDRMGHCGSDHRGYQRCAYK